MKRFGIRAKMDPSDPMSAPHLLGPDFQADRWYASREERDRALVELQSGRPYYRSGDTPSILYEPIEEEAVNSVHSIPD
ncbi:MAG: hypothetical protein ACYCS1_05770 [Gammaproteobacteria bacterium]